MEIPVQLLFLLPLSVASGLDLFLTTLAVATATVLGLHVTGEPFLGMTGTPTLPPWLGTPALMGLGGLYLTEAYAETRLVPAFVWHNLQLSLRPLGAFLLGWYLLWGEPLVILLAGSALAAVVAAFVHVLFWGQTILLRTLPSRRFSPAVLSLAADLACAVLLVLALLRPQLGFFLAILLLLSGLVFGRSHHGAVRFGLALLVDAAWAIVSAPGWHSSEELPSWIQEGAAAGTLVGASGARAATWGVTKPRRFSDGWILQRDSDLFFIHRRPRTVSVVAMSGMEEAVEVGPLWKTIRYRSDDGVSSALFLQVGLYGSESHKW